MRWFLKPVVLLTTVVLGVAAVGWYAWAHDIVTDENGGRWEIYKPKVAGNQWSAVCLNWHDAYGKLPPPAGTTPFSPQGADRDQVVHAIALFAAAIKPA